MQSTTAAQLLEATGGTLLFGSAAQCVNEAETDSRQCRPGMLFVPLIAARDGHDFIAPALAAGAEGHAVFPGAGEIGRGEVLHSGAGHPPGL